MPTCQAYNDQGQACTQLLLPVGTSLSSHMAFSSDNKFPFVPDQPPHAVSQRFRPDHMPKLMQPGWNARANGMQGLTASPLGSVLCAVQPVQCRFAADLLLNAVALLPAGAPIWFNPPELFNSWQAIRGVDLQGHFDYICPLTNKGRLPNILECQYEGAPQVQFYMNAAACQLFTYAHFFHLGHQNARLRNTLHTSFAQHCHCLHHLQAFAVPQKAPRSYGQSKLAEQTLSGD